MYFPEEDDYDFSQPKESVSENFRMTGYPVDDLFRRVMSGKKQLTYNELFPEFPFANETIEGSAFEVRDIDRVTREAESQNLEFHNRLAMFIAYSKCENLMPQHFVNYSSYVYNDRMRSFSELMTSQSVRAKPIGVFQFLETRAVHQSEIQDELYSVNNSASRESVSREVARKIQIVNSIIYQLIFIMAILQHEIDISFNWIDLQNFFSIEEYDDEYFVYRYNGRTIRIKAFGFVVKLVALPFATIRLYNRDKETVVIIPPFSNAQKIAESIIALYEMFVPYTVLNYFFRIPTPREINIVKAIQSRQSYNYIAGLDLRMLINLISFYHKPGNYYTFDHFFEYRPIVQYYNLYQILTTVELGSLCSTRDCSKYTNFDQQIYSETLVGAIITNTETIDQNMLNAMIGTSKTLYVTPRIFIDYILNESNDIFSEASVMFAEAPLVRKALYDMTKTKKSRCRAVYPMRTPAPSQTLNDFTDDILNGRFSVATFFDHIECIQNVSKFIQGIADPDTLEQFVPKTPTSSFGVNLPTVLPTLPVIDVNAYQQRLLEAFTSQTSSSANQLVDLISQVSPALGSAIWVSRFVSQPYAVMGSVVSIAAISRAIYMLMASQDSKEPVPVKRDISKDPCFIARGSQGVILKMFTEDGRGIAVKQSNRPIKKTDLSCPVNDKGEKGCKQDMNELIISILCSWLYTSGKSPHFVQIYDAFACDDLTPTWTDAVKRFAGIVPEAGNKDVTFPYIVMELIDGSMGKFPSFVSKLHSYYINVLHKPLHEIPTSSVLLDNAILQTMMALHTFQYELKGMHNDLHLDNVFLKICDDTPFNGKPLKDYEFFEYTMHLPGRDPVPVRIPNMGFIVKLGDMGHASVSFNVGGIGKVPHDDPGFHPEERVTYRKFIEYDANIDTPFEAPADTAPTYYWFPNIKRRIRQFTTTFLGMDKNKMGPLSLSLRMFFDTMGAQHVHQYLESINVRRRRSYNPSYDLGTFINHLATRSWGYYNRFVSIYGSIERKFHRSIHGNLNNYRYFIAFNVMQQMTRYPTYTLPHFEFSYTIATDIMEVYLAQNPEIGVLPQEIMFVSERLVPSASFSSFGRAGKMMVDLESFVRKYKKGHPKAIKKYLRAMHMAQDRLA